MINDYDCLEDQDSVLLSAFFSLRQFSPNTMCNEWHKYIQVDNASVLSTK